MKNRIEEKLEMIKEKGEKAFVTYMTAGLPDMEGCGQLIKAQEEAGTDILELGIPFSDPVADGPVIQAASYKSIGRGTNLKNSLELVERVRKEGCEVPIVFMMYFNTILFYGIENFVKACANAGIDGLIVPDLPFEEQKQLQDELDKNQQAPILIQLVSPVSGERIPMLLENARGFVYCVSSMGVTGQAAEFHKDVLNYLTKVKQVSKIPVMMGFGIRTPKDVLPMKEVIDGCIVGSHFINLLEEHQYDIEAAKEYCSSFRKELNG
ncbi:MAG: tryptophan synthase subunit alpha [Roseburia sp.]|nr:tryptophan synthase subunit alpha [Roseburia sp.]MCM1277405.1 tryptophan synthase subunit alpha [Robinsoniella sp.]